MPGRANNMSCCVRMGDPSVVHLLCVVLVRNGFTLEIGTLSSVRELFYSRAGVVRGVILMNESYIYP